MKLALILVLGLSAKVASAVPRADESQSHFDCFFKPQVDDDGWEKRGPARISSDSQGLRIEFADTGLDFVQTTDSPGEYQVEARCTGSVFISDNKPFKVRDLSFIQNDIRIPSNEGKIELVSKGAVANAKNETDEFEKNWTIKRSALDAYNAEKDATKKAKLNPFAAKGESKTLCATQLTLSFEDIRALAQRKQNLNPAKESAVELRHFLVTFDPC